MNKTGYYIDEIHVRKYTRIPSHHLDEYKLSKAIENWTLICSHKVLICYIEVTVYHCTSNRQIINRAERRQTRLPHL